LDFWTEMAFDQEGVARKHLTPQERLRHLFISDPYDPAALLRAVVTRPRR
jgi:hypothetical protein